MTAPRPFSEDGRQLVHISVGGFALLLRYVSAWQATVLAGGALAFNLYALPRLAPGLFRPSEAGRHRFFSGIALYPAAILLLLFAFPDRRDIVAASWGVLAFGDGTATLVGRRVRSARIPWNRDKSVAGTIAFVLCGGAAGSFLCWWCRTTIIPPAYWWFPIWMPWLAAIAAAAVETIPIRLDDNISVAAAASAVLWWTSLVGEDLAAQFVSTAIQALPMAVGANAAVAVVGFFARTVTVSGALCGTALGITIAVAAGWGGWSLLLATFAVAVVSSRLGWQRKMRLGIAEPRGGRRGAGNAIANTGVAAIVAVLGALTYARDAAGLAFVAALAAGGSDTVASEIGKAWGRRTFLVPTLSRVPPGTSGAISVEGTAAGLIAAVLLAALGVGLGLAPGTAVPAIVAAATIGSLAESLMGATLEAPGILNNDVLNFLNTAIAAAMAVVLVEPFQ